MKVLLTVQLKVQFVSDKDFFNAIFSFLNQLRLRFYVLRNYCEPILFFSYLSKKGLRKEQK